MFWTYLKIAYRNLKKNRLLTFINLFGLGFSMSLGMMEMVILQNELSYDRFHPHPDRTFRILTDYTQKKGNHYRLATTPLPLSGALLADKGVVEAAVSIHPAFKGTVKMENKEELFINGAYTQPSFFKVFGFSLAEGDPGTALQQPNTMVLSGATATRFFGNEKAVGKSLYVQGRGLFVVTGVLAKTGKSHIDFDAYASSASEAPSAANWGDLQAGYTYVLAKEHSNAGELNNELHTMVQQFNQLDRNGHARFDLQPLEKITPASEELYFDIGGGTGWTKLWVGIDITLIILIAACFNYTNLTIARALTRAKEVGVRKIVGARRYQVFLQYLTESVVQAFLALAFAWLLLSMIIRYAPFNDGYEMVPSSWEYNTVYVLCTVGYALFTGLLAGVAPAWILSAFRPLRVLKNLSTAKIFGKVGLQKSLVVFQYSLSLVIIIFLATFFRQFSMLSTADPGFKRDNVLVIPLAGTNAEVVSSRLAMVSGVRSVSAFSVPLQSHFAGTSAQAWLDHRPKDAISLNCFYADDAFIPTMGIQLLAGRNFGLVTDTSSEREIILNERAMKSLGFAHYDEALGKKIRLSDSLALEVIGIVNDFKYENAGKPVNPMAFRNKQGAYKYLYVGVESKDRPALVQRVTATWASVAPKVAFSPSWLDEALAENNSQRATISLLGYMAFIALSIATLGLLGLVIYTVETRRKETGIRKVIGASSSQIVGLLSKRFVRLLLISGAIAVPIGYTLSFLFLQNFVLRVGHSLLNAMACFLFLLSVGLVTIFSQTYRASLENPVHSLRTE
jgi:putative ABC transport system permease protein